MENINYAELFGVPTEEPEQEPDTDATEEMVEADNEQEDGEPAEVPGDEQDVTDPEDPAQGAPERAKREQTREENAAFAAARRKAEQQRDEAIAEARRQAQQEIDAVIAGMGLVNPYNNQPIKTKAEYDAYKADHDKQQRQTVARKAGMSEEEFDRFLQELPEVRKAKQAEEQAKEAQAQQRIQTEIAEISRLDPNIKSLADLTQMEDYPKFYQMVERGMTLSEAFKILHFDSIRKNDRERDTAVQRQAAINAAGKGHLTGSKARGAGSEPISQSVKAGYRKFMPKATDAAIAEHHRRFQKEIWKNQGG